MAKITKVEEQKKDDSRANIYVDGDFFIGLSKEIAYKLKLEENVEVDKDKLREIVEERTLEQAKNKAYQILNSAMQSEAQLRDKLIRRGFEENIIDKVIEKLKEYKMLNDEELARSIVRDRKNIKKYGKKRIINELKMKKIDKDIISSAIEELEDDEEYDNAVILAERKYRIINDTDSRKVYQKLSRYLVYRGYDYDTVKRVIRKVMQEEQD